jgi:hypothetical protein
VIPVVGNGGLTIEYCAAGDLWIEQSCAALSIKLNTKPY